MKEKIPDGCKDIWKKWNNIQGAKSPTCPLCGGLVHCRFIHKNIERCWWACNKCGKHKCILHTEEK